MADAVKLFMREGDIRQFLFTRLKSTLLKKKKNKYSFYPYEIAIADSQVIDKMV